MARLRSLVLFLLILPGCARRSIRIDDSHHGAQQQNNTLANGLQVSAEAQEAFIPGGVRTGIFRRQGPQAGALHKVALRDAGDPEVSTLPLSSHKFVDIGANLLDGRFTEGSYRGKARHEPDFDDVVRRAEDAGMKRMVLTAGTLAESRKAVETVRKLRKQGNYSACKLYCTVGVHPTRCLEFEQEDGSAEKNLQELLELVRDGMSDGTVAAVGEIGLDYYRLEFCPRDVQRKHFVRQLRLAEESGLPLFLHNRNVGTELYDLLVEHRDKWNSGVVHSFDDSIELARKFIGLGLFIGLNGCSLRTDENLRVVKQIPLEWILLETDCPFCAVKRTHAGYDFVKTHFGSKQEKEFEKGLLVKGRNEPCNIVQVAEVIAGAKEMNVKDLADTCYANSLRLYGWKD